MGNDATASQSGGDEKMLETLSELPGGKKFHFQEDVECIRVLASETKEVPWKAHQVLSAFVEDEDNEKICSKQILHRMALSAAVTALLYGVFISSLLNERVHHTTH